MGIQDDLNVQHDRARAIFTSMPGNAVVDPGDPPNGNDGYFEGFIQNVAHFLFAAGYTPAPPVTWPHRLIHEEGHAFEALLIRMGLLPAYVHARFWAWRFKGSAAAPPTWQEAQDTAWQHGTLGQWGHLPGEMWAEAFVAAVMGYVELERTEQYWLPVNALAARAFFLELMHEVAPVVYPAPSGLTLIAKNSDDTLFFYYRASDNTIQTYGPGFSNLGITKRWWQ